MSYAIRCSVCRVKFSWKPADGLPDECPNPECRTRMGHDNDDTVICMPSLRSARTDANDKVYRDMERGSEIRAQAAAELTGASVAEMSALKITDLKPTRHEGDVAAPPLPPHLRGVGGFADNGQSFGTGTSSGAVTVNGQVTTGIEPNAGMRAHTSVQRLMRGH